MPNQHPWDSISKELADWLTEDSKWLASAIRGEYASPFAAQTSEQEKLAYYRRQFYTQEPDGTINYEKPNLEGRQALIQRVGVDAYAEIAKAIGPGKTPESFVESEVNSYPSSEY